MSRLQTICFVFPNRSKEEKEWNHHFGSLLNGIPNSHHTDLNFQTMPKQYLPSVAFHTSDIEYPTILFRGQSDWNVDVGILSLVSQRNQSIKLNSMLSEQQDGVESNKGTNESLPIHELYHLLVNNLTGIDHAGVNLPTALFPHSQWNQLLSDLSEECNLYNYPEQDWPFIIPADEKEFLSDITDFTNKRTPKFEFVHDSYTTQPIFQFALETTLTQQQTEILFPGPSGFAIPGLDHIFRSVFVQSPWSEHLKIRVDLYYLSAETSLSDWETGEWLIKNGGRYQR